MSLPWVSRELYDLAVARAERAEAEAQGWQEKFLKLTDLLVAASAVPPPPPPLVPAPEEDEPPPAPLTIRGAIARAHAERLRK